MRSISSMKNMTFSLIAQVLNMILAFVGRTIFIKLLSTEYLGLSGLFTNILAVLSLSELGIGNAIIVNLYKPLANKDEDAICRYMNFYKKAYIIIGCFILIFGFISMPFLDYIVKTDVGIPNLNIIYFLFICNSAVSYFCAYKRTIFTVDQKEYINTINRNIFLVVQNILQIVVLIFTRRYELYVSIMVLCTFLSNIKISMVANKQYPYLKTNKSKLSSNEIKELFGSLKAILYHKVGNTIINSTDNIIISLILGVYWVGLYSNYSMIVGIVTTFALIIFSACSASIGNFNAVESKERMFDMFKTMSFIGFWVYGFCSICFMVLFQPFICIWIGSQYQVDGYVLFFIILAFFLKGVIGVTVTFIDVTKLFIKTRRVPWIMAGINVVVSIILAKYIGLVGVFVGTVISYILTEFWINPFVLCKYRFDVDFGVYLRFIARNLMIVVLNGIIVYLIVFPIDNFIAKLIISVLVSNIIFVACNYKTNEFKYLLDVVKNVISTFTRRKNE